MTGAEILTRFTADTSEVSNATKGFNTGLGKLTTSFTLANVAASAINKTLSVFSQNLDSAIGRFDTMNNFPKVMSNLGIKAEDSSEVISDLSDKLKGLPTALDDGARAIQRFTSANGDIKQSEKIFLALNNAILAGGANSQIQASALEQLTQAYSKGKMDMMEWRTLQMAMPAQLNQVAKAMGTTTDALGESLRKGETTKEAMEEFIATMIKLNETGVDGFASFEEQARGSTQGISTSIANMKTAVVRGITGMLTSINESLTDLGGISGVMGVIGKAGEEAFKGIGEAVGQVMPIIIEFGKDIMPTIQNAINKVAPRLKDLGSKLLPAIQKMINKLEPIMENIADKMLPVITSAIDSLMPVVEPLIDFISSIIELHMAWDSILWELLGNILPPLMQFISNLATTLLPTLTTIIRGMIDVVLFIPTMVGNVINGVKDGVNGFMNFIKPVFDFLKNIIIGYIAIVTNVWDTIWNVVLKPVANFIYNNVLKPIHDFFKNTFDKVWGIVKPIIDKIKNAFEKIKQPVETVFRAIGDTIKNIFGTIGEVIKTPINAIIDGINKVLKKINDIKIPDWVPGLGGKHTNFGMIPKLNVGTNYVPQDTLAVVHKGEAVIPKKFNPYASGIKPQTLGNINTIAPNINVIVNAQFETDPLGQVVQNIKTFSGGAKNDYNYGVGR